MPTIQVYPSWAAFGHSNVEIDNRAVLLYGFVGSSEAVMLAAMSRRIFCACFFL
jgi:hypothetical protein